MFKYFLGLLLLLGTLESKDYDFTYRNWKAAVTHLTSDLGFYYEGVEVAMNDLGKVVAVWELDETNQVQVNYSTDRGQTFATASTISVESGFVPQVAINNAGQAVIVFHNATTATIQVAFSQNGGATWSTPESISTYVAGQTMNSPQVALNASGQAVAVWDRKIGASYKIQSSYSADGGATWTSEVDVSTAGQSSLTPEVALNASGRQVVIWDNDTSNVIQVSFSIDNGTIWSTTNLATVNNFDNYHVGLNASDQVLVVWTNKQNNRISSLVSANGGVTWTNKQILVSAAGEVATTSEMALNDAGQAIAVWQNTTISRVQAAASTDGGTTWATPIILSAAGGNAKEPDVALNAAGQATAVWGRYSGSSYIGQSNYSTDGGLTWIPSTSMINFSTLSVVLPKVAIDAAGWSVATWTGGGDYYLVQANNDYNHGIIQAERQKVRFPLSIDLVDEIRWPTLAGVLTYNIYSDVNLTQLVESYSGSNFYFRHQMKEEAKHYYFRVTTANFTSSALDIELP